MKFSLRSLSTPLRHRLLYIINDYRFFQSHRLPLAQAAVRAGFRVGVAGPQHDLGTFYKDRGIEYFPIPLRRSISSALSEVRALGAILRVLRSFRPDVAHLITAKPIIYGGLMCRMRGVPTLAAITGLGHAFMMPGRRGNGLRRALLLGYRAAVDHKHSHIIFQNSDDLEIFRCQGALRKAAWSLVPGSGVDLSEITPHPLPDGETVVTLPGRMLRDKGVVEFVQAARILRERGVSARFRLLGDPDSGNPTSIGREQLEAWACEGAIEWMPHTNRLNKALADSHIIALPSYREGFPKTLIDAAAAGRAAVAADVPGCRDAIVAGKTGLLFRARDPTAMADALAPLIQDRTTQEAMGRAAREHAEKYFDITNVCTAHLSLYTALTCSRQRDRGAVSQRVCLQASVAGVFQNDAWRESSNSRHTPRNDPA